VDDYHTYEIFVQMFGANFYLRNPTLTLRYRTTREIYREKTVHLTLSKFDFTDEKMLFSQTYNAAYLVDQVLRPESKLHNIFIRWCQEHFPSGYENIIYDDDYLLKKEPPTKALAELMLLDLGIVELTDAYPLAEVPSPELAPLRLAIVVEEEANNYLKEKSGAQDPDASINFRNLLSAVENQGVTAIWEAIKDRVATRLFAEFDMLYASIDSADFTHFIDTGRQIEYNVSPKEFDRSDVYVLYTMNEKYKHLRANSVFQSAAEENVAGNDYAAQLT
jgi:hypothetical protein